MPIVHMTWQEAEFEGELNNGQDDGFVFQVIGPSYLYPSHREPVSYSPHGCKNSRDSHQLVIPIIAALTFERSAARSHSFHYPGNQEHPTVALMLTTEADPYGKYYQLAHGQYDLPADAREDETYQDATSPEWKVAKLEMAMNEVKAIFLNLSFDFNEDVPFFFAGRYNLWANYWGFCNYTSLYLRGAPDHARLVDMKYGRPPRA